MENCDLVVIGTSVVRDRASDNGNFTKTPVPLSKSPGTSPSIRAMTQTVIVSLAETVTHNITYGKSCCIAPLTDIFLVAIHKQV